jgi:hypothetical protein
MPKREKRSQEANDNMPDLKINPKDEGIGVSGLSIDPLGVGCRCQWADRCHGGSHAVVHIMCSNGNLYFP